MPETTSERLPAARCPWAKTEQYIEYHDNGRGNAPPKPSSPRLAAAAYFAERIVNVESASKGLCT